MGWLRTPGLEEKHRSHVSHLPCSGTRRPGRHLPPQASPADMKQEAYWHGQPGGWARETLSTAAGASHPHLGAQSNRGSTADPGNPSRARQTRGPCSENQLVLRTTGRNTPGPMCQLKQAAAPSVEGSTRIRCPQTSRPGDNMEDYSPAPGPMKITI